KVLGKSDRAVASVIGSGYVEAPQAIKNMVEKGKLGASIVPIINAAGLEPEDRVKLAEKISAGTISTTGTTLQSQLMPRVRVGDEIARRLIRDPNFSLEDARRADEARAAAKADEIRREKLRRAKENERERPKTMSEVSFEIEGDFVSLTGKLRSLNEL